MTIMIRISGGGDWGLLKDKLENRRDWQVLWDETSFIKSHPADVDKVSFESKWSWSSCDELNVGRWRAWSETNEQQWTRWLGTTRQFTHQFSVQQTHPLGSRSRRDGRKDRLNDRHPIGIRCLRGINWASTVIPIGWVKATLSMVWKCWYYDHWGSILTQGSNIYVYCSLQDLAMGTVGGVNVW